MSVDIMSDMLIRITHLFINIIDQCFLDEDDLPLFDLTFKTSTCTNVYDQIGLPPAYRILSRTSSCDFPPTSLDKYDGFV